MINLDNVSKIDLELTGGLSAVVSKAELNAITVKNKATAASAADLNRNNGLDAALTTAGKTTAEHIDKIVDLTGMNSSASEIDGSVNLAHHSVSSFIRQLKLENRHMSILINSDSTGNATNEWVYYFAQWLAANYPVYTVRYRIWNDSLNAYDGAENINTGTSLYNIDVWNFAVSGTQVNYILGKTKVLNGLVDITNKITHTTSSDIIDLTIINHSHNVTVNGRYVDTFLPYAMFTEKLLEIHPFSSIMQIKQNPLRDSYLNTLRVQAAIDWARDREFCIADVWAKFETLNKNSNLYADDTHPSTGLGTIDNPTGTRLFLDAVTDELTKISNNNLKLFNSLTNLVCKNNVINGNFLTWTTPASTAPDGWIVSGGIASKDTIDYDDVNKRFSCKITSNGGTNCYLMIEIASSVFAKLQKGWYTASVKMKINDNVTTTANSGRLSVITNTDSSSSAPSYSFLQGEWHYKFSRIYIKPTDTYVRIYIYLSSNNLTSGEIMNIDNVNFSKGKMPFGIGI